MIHWDCEEGQANDINVGRYRCKRSKECLHIPQLLGPSRPPMPFPFCVKHLYNSHRLGFGSHPPFFIICPTPHLAHVTFFLPFFFFQFSNIHHFYFYFCFLTKSNLGVILCIETFFFLGHKPNKEAKSRSVGGLVYATVALNQTISSRELGHDKMVSKSNL